MVIPERGLIWCPNAKVGSSTMVGVLPLLIGPNASARPQTRRLVERESLVHDVPPWAHHGAALGRLRKNLQPADRHRVVFASEMEKAARQELCTSGRALTFTTVRSPWERMVSAYLDKVADGSGGKRGSVDVSSIRRFLGMPAGEPIPFAGLLEFVSKQPDKKIDIHFMPMSFRCGVGMGHYLIESHIDSGSLEDDVKLILRSLGESEDLFKERGPRDVGEVHISSAEICGQSKLCTANLEAQIGPKATWIGNGTGEIARKLYKSWPGHDLAEIVRQRYADDAKLLGYAWPGHIDPLPWPGNGGHLEDTPLSRLRLFYDAAP